MDKSSCLVVAFGLGLVGLGVAGTFASTATQTPSTEFVVRGVRVFDGERVLPKASVHVRDGKIVSVGDTAPGGVESIPGSGRTLLPGLIDAHAHAFGDALERALVFGVTTEFDMFTDYRFAATTRTEHALGHRKHDRCGERRRAPQGHAARALHHGQ